MSRLRVASWSRRVAVLEFIYSPDPRRARAEAGTDARRTLGPRPLPRARSDQLFRRRPVDGGPPSAAFSGAPATYVTVGPFRYGYGYDPSTRDRAAAGPGARTATAAARKLLA